MNSEQFSDLVVTALEEVKAQDIVKLDVKELTTVTDYMIVASGTSSRHVKALADAVAEKSREAGQRPAGVEGEAGGSGNSTISKNCGPCGLNPDKRLPPTASGTQTMSDGHAYSPACSW